MMEIRLSLCKCISINFGRIEPYVFWGKEELREGVDCDGYLTTLNLSKRFTPVKLMGRPGNSKYDCFSCIYFFKKFS